MTMWLAIFPPVLRSLIAATAVSMICCGSSPANAQSTPVATKTTATALRVAITGTVSGLPESVSFSGIAHLNANVVTDPDFGAVPTVVLSIDLDKITGIGSSTGKRYVGTSQETLNRRLTAADSVQFTFPFVASGGNAMSPRVGMVSFNLSYNVDTMVLTGATAQILNP